jgi:hypothetical protein
MAKLSTGGKRSSLLYKCLNFREENREKRIRIKWFILKNTPTYQTTV